MSDAPFDLVDAKDSFIDTDWFHACQQSQTPYVVVRSGDTTADVLWDYVTLPPSCDLKLRSSFSALERGAQAIFDRFAVEDSYLRVKPTMICFDHLPIDDAKRAAGELYRLIASYLPDRTRSKRAPAQPSLIANARPRHINANHGTSAASRRLWVENNDPSSSAA